MCSEAKADAHRFRDIILAAIDDDKVKLYKKFKPWSEKVAKQPRPKAPLAPVKANASEAADAQKQLIQQIRCSATLLVTGLRLPSLMVAGTRHKQCLEATDGSPVYSGGDKMELSWGVCRSLTEAPY